VGVAIESSRRTKNEKLNAQNSSLWEFKMEDALVEKD